MDWLTKNWPALVAGLGLGAIVGYAYKAHADTTPLALPSGNPAAVTLPLQPGGQYASIAPNGTVTLTLPTGAKWSTSATPISPLTSGAAQPTGNQSMPITFVSTGGAITANWVDANGAAQTTSISVTVG